MNSKKQTVISYMLYFIIFIAASIPVTCNYIMEGGIVEQWIMRVEEMAMSLPAPYYLLFPSEEVIVESSGQLHALQSNLWFLLPAVVNRLGGSITRAYQIYMLLVQLGTLAASILLFTRLYGRQSMASMFGVLLYMTCPYRIYICYDLADLAQAAAWMMLPLYVWGLLGMWARRGRIQGIVIAAIALAGIGYASSVMLPVVAVCTVVVCIFKKKLTLLIPVAAGTILCIPGLLPLIKYVFMGRSGTLVMPLQGIMEQGYSFSNVFTFFVYAEGKPGLGAGLLMSLLILVWLYFVRGNFKLPGKSLLAAAFAVLFLLCSLKAFPWDIVQRVGLWMLRIVPLFGSPALFFGFACFAACIPGAYAVQEINQDKNKVVGMAIPVIIFTAALAICVYMCNELTYSRFPLT